MKDEIDVTDVLHEKVEQMNIEVERMKKSTSSKRSCFRGCTLQYKSTSKASDQYNLDS
ncbi:hypothetical protein WUBG_02893, partial [Wuchereria bancrofti]